MYRMPPQMAYSSFPLRNPVRSPAIAVVNKLTKVLDDLQRIVSRNQSRRMNNVAATNLLPRTHSWHEALTPDCNAAAADWANRIG